MRWTHRIRIIAAAACMLAAAAGAEGQAGREVFPFRSPRSSSTTG